MSPPYDDPDGGPLPLTFDDDLQAQLNAKAAQVNPSLLQSPAPAAPVASTQPEPDAPGTFTNAPMPGAQFALPPDVAARAKLQALSLPAVGPAPHQPGDSVSYSGPPPEQAGAPMAPPAPAAPAISSATTKTTTSGVPLSPATQAAQAQMAQASKLGAAELPGALKQQQAAQNYRAAAEDNATNQANANADAMLQQQQEHEAALAPIRVDIRDAQDALAKRQVDPDHYMHSRSTVQRIGGILGTIISGFGAGLAHQPNMAAEHINKAIDDDIDAQKANIAKGQKDLENKVGGFNLKAGAYKDAEQKDQAARAIKLSAAQEQIKQAVENEQDPQRRQALIETGQAVAARQVEASAKLDEMVTGKITTSTHTTVSSGGAGAAGGGLPADRVVRGPNGKMYLAPDAKTAQEHRTLDVAARRLKSTMDKIDALNNGVGSGLPWTDSHAQMGVLQEQAKADLAAVTTKRAKLMGVDSKEFAEKTVGDPSSAFDWHTGTRTKAIRAMADQNLNDSLGEFSPLNEGSLALQGGKPVYTGTGVPVLPTGKGKGAK